MNDNAELFDATWSPCRNTEYTTYSDNVTTMSELFDKVIAIHNQVKDPSPLRVSNDDAIFLTDFKAGVCQPVDDGISWSLVFKSPDGLHFNQVIKITTILTILSSGY